jgi:hypothetical protein
MTRMLAIALACLLTPLAARAQFESSSVLGTVRDKTGATIADRRTGQPILRSIFGVTNHTSSPFPFGGSTAKSIRHTAPFLN